MALVESLEECAKAVIHGVISDTNAKIVASSLESHKTSLTHTNACREHIILNLTSPKDIMNNMEVVVDVLVVEQVMKCSEFQE